MTATTKKRPRGRTRGKASKRASALPRLRPKEAVPLLSPLPVGRVVRIGAGPDIALHEDAYIHGIIAAADSIGCYVNIPGDKDLHARPWSHVYYAEEGAGTPKVDGEPVAIHALEPSHAASLVGKQVGFCGWPDGGHWDGTIVYADRYWALIKDGRNSNPPQLVPTTWDLVGIIPQPGDKGYVQMVKLIGTITQDEPEPYPIMECAGIVYKEGADAEREAVLATLLPLALSINARKGKIAGDVKGGAK